MWKRSPQFSHVTNTHRAPHRTHVYPSPPAASPPRGAARPAPAGRRAAGPAERGSDRRRPRAGGSSAPQREVAVLRYVLDLSTEEIATQMRTSEGTVKSQLFKARGHLAQALSLVEDTDEENSHAEHR